MVIHVLVYYLLFITNYLYSYFVTQFFNSILQIKHNYSIKNIQTNIFTSKDIEMTETKQSMQNTIKNLQAKSQYINKLEDKGSKALVLQLGSHTIKMGFANQKAPFMIRPFIAYKKNQITKSEKTQASKKSESFDYQSFKSQYQKLQQRLKIQGIISHDNRTLKGKPRSKQIVYVDKMPQFHPSANTLYGQQALWVQKDPQYIFKKPLQYGFFNVPTQEQIDDDSYYSFQQIIKDLQNLVLYMVAQKLKIPSKQWRNFSCVVVVPDIFIRKHVKYFIQRLFKTIGFKKIYLHVESVLACFGTAVNSACVVDIGHQKINICCVDQGIIVPQTLIRKNYGMKHISKSLCKIFAERVNDKEIGQIKYAEEADLNQIDKVKEISTLIKQPDESINRVYEIDLVRKSTQIPFQVSYSDSICVISNSIFSDLWNSFQNNDRERDQFNLHSQYFDLYEDPEDYLQEYSGGGHLYQINRSNSDQLPPCLYDPFSYQPLDQLILTCLQSIKQKQQRKRYYSNILFIGGGSLLSKLSEQIISRLNIRLGLDQTQKVDVASDLMLREISPIHASWLGGTVIPKLDSLRDLWIERTKFMGDMGELEEQDEHQNTLDRKLFTRKEQSEVWAVAYLKEKVPFIW